MSRGLSDQERARSVARPAARVMPKWPLRRNGEAASSNAGLPSDSAASAASQRPAKRTGEELAKLVGPVTESREQHLRRHKNGMKSCPRCRYYSRLDTWTRSYGHVKEAASAGPRNSLACRATDTLRWNVGVRLPVLRKDFGHG